MHSPAVHFGCVFHCKLRPLEVLQAILLWMDGNFKERAPHIGRLLSAVRLGKGELQCQVIAGAVYRHCTLHDTGCCACPDISCVLHLLQRYGLYAGKCTAITQNIAYKTCLPLDA